MLKLLSRTHFVRLFNIINLRPIFAFGGGHDDHHHEIDREKIRLSDKKTGKFVLDARLLYKSK